MKFKLLPPSGAIRVSDEEPQGTSGPYDHQLNSSQGEIRLLRWNKVELLDENDNKRTVIAMVLEYAYLADNPEYTALSYEWGTGVNTLDNVQAVVDGYSVQLTYNLLQA